MNDETLANSSETDVKEWTFIIYDARKLPLLGNIVRMSEAEAIKYVRSWTAMKFTVTATINN